jgi:hypothetical protein
MGTRHLYWILTDPLFAVHLSTDLQDNNNDGQVRDDAGLLAA